MATKSLSAIYSRGVFRPSVPVNLPEDTEVTVMVPVPTESEDLKTRLRKFCGTVKLSRNSVEWQRNLRDSEWS